MFLLLKQGVPVWNSENTVSILQNAQLLLNKQQQIWTAVYIQWHFSSSTDTVVLPETLPNMVNLLSCELTAVDRSI